MGSRARNLTMEDKRAMMGLREAGYTNAEIARQMDVSVGTVTRWLGKQRFRGNKSAAPTVTRTLPKIIAVDFDGTLCASAFPDIGAPNIPLIDLLIARRRNGCRVECSSRWVIWARGLRFCAEWSSREPLWEAEG